MSCNKGDIDGKPTDGIACDEDNDVQTVMNDLFNTCNGEEPSPGGDGSRSMVSNEVLRTECNTIHNVNLKVGYHVQS